MSAPVPPHSPLPVPPSGRGRALALVACALTGALLVVLALAALLQPATPAPMVAQAAPAVAVPAPGVPQPASVPDAQAPVATPVKDAPAPTTARDVRAEQRFARNDGAHVRAAWVARFYRSYETVAKASGVSWLLLASIHKQETAFSTHPTTYRGLNFAGCCGGPMQFNVTNGAVSTWDRYKHSFKGLERPADYPNRTRRHPSLYDDFDALAAAGALLRDSGAGPVLDASAWRAAYDYYGHDLTGVDYASEVVARAIGWGRNGFCINCATDPDIRAAVDAAWGAPVRAELAPPAPQPKAVAASRPRED